MSVAMVLVIVLAVLFGIAFLTKRRFGVLGLALAAGSILSSLWATELTPAVYEAGINIVSPPLPTVVGAILVLLPAVVLLFRGPTYKDTTKRIVGAAAFGLLASAFLLPILGDALVLEGDGKKLFDMIMTYRVWIVTAGLVLAVLDIMSTKSKKDDGREK